MLRHTVGYAVGCVTLPIVLVLSMITALFMWATRSLPLPVARSLGHGDEFVRWGDRATERLMEVAGGPLRLTGRIIGGGHVGVGRGFDVD
jgi:hypothetical protein